MVESRPLARSYFPAVVLLAAALHGAGIARSSLPAQDGLKFIRIARSFQNQFWTDVVRGSDQHPLYPAIVALAEPAVALVAGHSPTTWRITAQLVSAVAALALLWPLHGLSRALFGSRVADLAVLGFVLLPLPMALGHDTLSDSLALAAVLVSLRLGLLLLRTGSWPAAVGCGFAAGCGFLTRPEVLLAPIAVLAVGGWRLLGDAARHATKGPLVEDAGGSAVAVPAPRFVAVAIVFLVMVGNYTLIKGEVSEKLALRLATGMRAAAARPHAVRANRHALPPGLDDPRLDFSPKEESATPARSRLAAVVGDLALQWTEGLGWILALFALWGLVRDRTIRTRVAAADEDGIDPDGAARLLVLAYLVPFALVLVRHETRMGYLSHRHVMTLVLLSLPWAAAGVFVCASRTGELLRLERRTARVLLTGLLGLGVATGASLQLKPLHESRRGHHDAGLWLASNAGHGEAVLDTRGWAAFVSGRPAYDYWHVRQALSDGHLTYVVVGEDELDARSRRASTLRAVLAHAATPVAEFPKLPTGRDDLVRVYRFHRPESWEGLRP